MPNMSYCRFENTASDLVDCLANLHDDLGETEHKARKRLLILCARILIDADVDSLPINLVDRAKAAADVLPVDA